MDKLVAVITSYNREEFITKCLKSLLDSADENLDVNLLVMDNGSSDRSPELAASFGEKIRLEHTEDNRPLIEVINRGIRIAIQEMKPDYIILMNEDTEFQPGSLNSLVAVAKEHPNALLTPLQINYYQPDRVDPIALTHARETADLLEDFLIGRPLKSAYPLRTIIGAGMLARREVWERLGYWDELFIFYGSDDDYCNRALHLGYEVLLVPQTRLLHAHGNINAKLRAPSNRGESRRWYLLTQKRYMLILKNPKETLIRCLMRLVGRFVSSQFKFFFSLWPKAMILSTMAFGDCIIKLTRVAAARKDQFSESRRAI